MSKSKKTNSGNGDYDLSIKEAADSLGKSTRTIHRYIEKGKLSRIYVTTENGKEIRLKSGEVLRLAAKLNDRDGKPSAGDSGEAGSGPFGSDDPTRLNIRELLSRYERTLWQLRETSEKLKEAKHKKEGPLFISSPCQIWIDFSVVVSGKSCFGNLRVSFTRPKIKQSATSFVKIDPRALL